VTTILIIRGCVILIWVAVGIATFVSIDREQMKKHVPYGRMSSAVTLRQIRWMMLVISLIVWPVAALAALFKMKFAQKEKDS